MKQPLSPTAWEAHRTSFDTIAERYGKYRPGYPAELIDRIIELSGLTPSARILEVGCGAGQATVLFARHGYSMVCIEPGANLLQVAASKVSAFPSVEFECVRFEDWPEPTAAFDLVMSAQAFHWIPQPIGYAKAAAALKPGGHLALFWNRYVGCDSPVGEALDQVYREITPELERDPTQVEEVIKQIESDIVGSGHFTDVTVHRFPWQVRYDTQQYLGLLGTYSDHLLLDESTRERLFQGVAEVIDAAGGCIDRPYLAVLYVASRVSDQ